MSLITCGAKELRIQSIEGDRVMREGVLRFGQTDEVGTYRTFSVHELDGLTAEPLRTLRFVNETQAIPYDHGFLTRIYYRFS